MPKEYRYEGLSEVYLRRPSYTDIDAALRERDVSDWRPSPAESELVVELRRLRSLDRVGLELALDVNIDLTDNSYGMDVAVLFHLIRRHGLPSVQAVVAEMIGRPLDEKRKTQE